MKYGLVLLFGWWFLPLAGQQIHLIVLADTTDPALRPAVLANVDRLRNQGRQLARHLGMDLCLMEFMAGGLRFAAADSLVGSLACGPDDVVFFHYSGHGVNSGTSHWPRFRIEDPENKADLLYFNALLRRKGPRLLISMADCCNTGGWIRHKQCSPPPLPGVSSPPMDTARLAVLFRESAGNLVCSGSRAGQSSFYEDHLGGYFTLAFWYALYQAGPEPPPWDRLLADVCAMTTHMTAAMGRQQEPQFLWIPAPTDTLTTVAPAR